jgi:hypothetical protein
MGMSAIEERMIVYAYRTEGKDYPPYFILAEDGDGLIVTMREPPESSPFPAVGAMGKVGLGHCIGIPRSEAKRLAHELCAWLAATGGADKADAPAPWPDPDAATAARPLHVVKTPEGLGLAGLYDGPKPPKPVDPGPYAHPVRDAPTPATERAAAAPVPVYGVGDSGDEDPPQQAPQPAPQALQEPPAGPVGADRERFLKGI